MPASPGCPNCRVQAVVLLSPHPTAHSRPRTSAAVVPLCMAACCLPVIRAHTCCKYPQAVQTAVLLSPHSGAPSCNPTHQGCCGALVYVCLGRVLQEHLGELVHRLLVAPAGPGRAMPAQWPPCQHTDAGRTRQELVARQRTAHTCACCAVLRSPRPACCASQMQAVLLLLLLLLAKLHLQPVLCRAECRQRRSAHAAHQVAFSSWFWSSCMQVSVDSGTGFMRTKTCSRPLLTAASSWNSLLHSSMSTQAQQHPSSCAVGQGLQAVLPCGL